MKPDTATTGFPQLLRATSALFAAVAIAVAFTPINASAVESTGDGDWFDTDTWDSGMVPSDGDGQTFVDIFPGDQVNASIGSGGWDEELNVGAGAATGTSVLLIDGGTLISDGGGTAINDIGSGGNRTGTITVTGGLISMGSNNSYFASGDATSKGNLNVSGGTASFGGEGGTAQNVRLGDVGVGTATLTGGVTNFGTSTGVNSAGDENDSTVGHNSGSTGILNISGSARLNVERDLRIAQNNGAVGFLNMSGGTLEIDGDLFLGSGPGSLGSMNFTGGSVLLGRDGSNTGGGNTGANLYVGNNGTGLLHVESGDLSIERFISIGRDDVGIGSVLVTGGRLTTNNNQNIDVGQSTVGYLTVNGGTVYADGSVNAGGNRNQNGGTATSSGTGVINLISGVLRADDTVTGNSNGNLTVGHLVLRNNAGATVDRGLGTMTQSGGIATANQILIGNQGDGYLNMSGGTQATQGNYIIGVNTVIATINGGTGTVREQGTGFVTISGGLVNIDDNLILAQVRDSYGSMNISGGLVQTSTNLTNRADHINIGGNGTTGVGGGADYGGQGFIRVSGGTLLHNPQSIGTTNPTATLDDRDILIGFGGHAASLDTANYGELRVDSGLVRSARDIRVSINSYNTGRLEVNGGLLTADDAIRLADGNDTVGTFVQTGGTIITDLAGESGGSGEDGAITFADGLRSTTVATISGGIQSVNGRYYVARAAGAVATINMTGGLIRSGSGTDGLGGGGNQDVNFGNNATARGVLNMSGGTWDSLDNNREFNVGVNGTGIMNLSGTARVTHNGNIYFGRNNGSYGELNLSGGASIVTDADADGDAAAQGDSIAFGLQGGSTGIANISGGTLAIPTNRDIRIGVRADSYGSVNFSGGEIFGGELNVAEGSGVEGLNDAGASRRALGVFNQSGGTGFYTGSIFVGRNDDSSGTYIQTGGSSTTNSSFIMASIGSVEQHVETTGNLDTRFGTTFGAAEGSATITGGSLTVGDAANEDIQIGVRGNADMTIGGDAVVTVADDIILGVASDAVGTDTGGAGTGRGMLTIGGTSTVTVNDDLFIAGDSGTATVDEFTVGSVNITGGATTVGGQVRIAIGNNRTGTLNQTGGSLQVDERIQVGNGSNVAGVRAVASYTLSGGLLELGTSGGAAGTLTVDNHADANVTLSGGTMRTTSAGADLGWIQAAGTNANVTLTEGAVVDLRGGRLQTNNSIDQFNVTAGEVRNAAEIGHIAGDAAALGDMVDLNVTGGLIRPSEDGTARAMALRASGGTGLGNYTQSGGTFLVDLTGDGVIGDGVTDSSTEGAAGGAIIANTVNLAGATIKVVDSGVTSFDLLEQWDILGWYDFFGGTEGSGTLGSLAGLTFDFSMANGGVGWDTSLFASSGVIQIIPEPSRVLLLIVGLAAATMRRRRGGLI